MKTHGHMCVYGKLVELVRPHSPESTYFQGRTKSLPSDCIRGFVFYVDLDVDIMRICSNLSSGNLVSHNK